MSVGVTYEVVREGIMRGGRYMKPSEGNPEDWSATRFPFSATINGEPVTVWNDWIEREEFMVSHLDLV